MVERKETDVKHQHHYEANGIQPIEYMVATFDKDEMEGFLKGNIIKYLGRYKKKNGFEDLKKAKVYLDWLIDYVEGGEINLE